MAAQVDVIGLVPKRFSTTRHRRNSSASRNYLVSQCAGSFTLGIRESHACQHALCSRTPSSRKSAFDPTSVTSSTVFRDERYRTDRTLGYTQPAESLAVSPLIPASAVNMQVLEKQPSVSKEQVPQDTLHELEKMSLILEGALEITEETPKEKAEKMSNGNLKEEGQGVPQSPDQIPPETIALAEKAGCTPKNYVMWYVPSLTQIEENLFLGNVSASLSPEVLSKTGITALVSLLNNPEPIWAGWDAPENRLLVPRKRHMFIYTPDTQNYDILRLLPDILAFIDQQVSEPAASPEALGGIWGDWGQVISEPRAGWMEETFPLPKQTKPPKVLVHCKAGKSRSSTVIIAYMMKKERLTAAAAIAKVKKLRDLVDPNPNFCTALKVWEACGYELWEDAEHRVPKGPYAKYLENLGQGSDEYDAWRASWEGQ